MLKVLFFLNAALTVSACDPSALKTKTAATQTDVQRMPDIGGVDHRGQLFSLTEALSKGPVVVVFYRGHW